MNVNQINEAAENSQSIDGTAMQQTSTNTASKFHSSEISVAKKTIKRQRAGKKGAVTRRVNAINGLIESRGSRTAHS